MLQSSDGDMTVRRCYALCVGISTYTNLLNRNLRYAGDDATTIADQLHDPQRGNFDVRVLTEPMQTTKKALDEAVKELLSASDRQAEDLTLLYFSCHGDVNKEDNTFCLLPSNATQQANGAFEQTTLIGISDLARWFSQAKTHNIVLLLDVCHSGGAGKALQHFNPHLETGPNYFILGAARQGLLSDQSSRLKHGVFTSCLLRAFEQPPTKDGWLTISQIQNFISEEITWFAKDRPLQIQISSMAVDPSFPLLRNPGYPELCPLPPFWNVPFQRNIFFTEQDGLLSQLASMLKQEQKMTLTQPSAISGLGGIGKTQVALEYAYRHRQDYHAVLWGRADTRESLISTFVTIASLLGFPQKDEQDQMVIVEAVKKWLMDRSRWLFILDNADDVALVQEFLPAAFRGHLLLTTRAQTTGKVVESRLEVEVMRPGIGALLLLRRARILDPEASLEEAPEEEVTRAKELAKELGGLPLALDQAGAYIEETQCGLAGYGHLYQTRRAELLRNRGGVIDDHPEPVATTWSLSFERVEQCNSAAADLLRLCAFLAPDAIPEELLNQGARKLGDVLAPVAADAYQLNQAITALRAYSLISRDPQTQALTVHRLVQAVLRDSMPSETQRQWMRRAVYAVIAAFPSITFENWSTYESLLPHALACVTWIDQAPLVTLEAACLLSQIGYYLYNRTRYGEAELLLLQGMQLYERLLGPVHLDLISPLNMFAALYKEWAKYEQAKTFLERALYIREQLLGSVHLDVAASLDKLADLNLDEWEHIRQPALEKDPSLYLSSFSGYLRNINNILHWEHNDIEASYKRALSIREQLLSPLHPEMVISLTNLAQLYTVQGEYFPSKYREAESLCRRALSICETISEPEYLFTSLEVLADLYSKQNRYRKAEPLLQRALALREQILPPQHPVIADSLEKLALCYINWKKYNRAALLLERILAIRINTLGDNHSDIALCLHNWGCHYAKQRQYKKAEPLFQQALAIWMKVLGVEHPNTIQAHENYKMLQRKMRR